MIRSILKNIFILFVVFVFSQIPSFMKGYANIVKGALLEVDNLIEGYTKQASRSNKSLSEYIDKYLQSSDVDFRNTGELMLDTIERRQKYQKVLHILEKSSKIYKLFLIIPHLDWNMIKKNDLEPKITFDQESILYVIAGLLIGMFLAYLIFRPKIQQ